MQIKLEEILKFKDIKVSFRQATEELKQVVIDHVMFDSRKHNVGTNTLFLSLAGKKSHINQARSKGVKLFMVSSKPKDVGAEEVFIVCKNVLRSFQKIAKQYRKKHEGKFIGITGSNGKTITKEWVHTLLNGKFVTDKSPGSYNSQLGVPLSVLGIEESAEYAIIEAGISKSHEMENLEKVIRPDIGILTTMGDAHSAGFTSFKQKVNEKLKLFKGAKKIIYEQTEEVNEKIFGKLDNENVVSWSRNRKYTTYKVKVEKKAETRIKIMGKSSASFSIPFKDEASISNVVHVLILGLELKLDLSYIQTKINDLRNVSMRLELLTAPRNSLIINDSYNSDIISLQSAMEFAMMQKNERKLTLILSEFDNQRAQKKFYKKLENLISSYAVDQFIYVGEEQESLSYDLKFSRTSELLDYLIDNKSESELILIKGARRYKFESIATYLQENPHKTILQTRLSSISNNLKYFRSLGKGKHKIMGVVKAGAYGSDSVRIGKYLDNFGIDYLAVAFIEEGIELRKEGVNSPIMVMNPDPSLFLLASEYSLELEIFSFNQLEKLDIAKEIKIHINVDTGMNRLGFKEEELDRLIDFILCREGLKVESIFTHLSSSDEKEKVAVNKKQEECFNKFYSILTKGIGYKPVKHISNSHGAINFPEMHYNMIRVGIGMHGLIADDKLECAHRLTCVISQVKQIKKGESVGYNQGFIASKDIKTATVSVGYADGISRKHGKGRSAFFIQGIPCKTVGNIAMDTSIIDVSGMDVSEGDEVVIFENKEQLFNLCKTAEVIPYEFLCGIGKRVARNSFMD